MKSFLSQIDEQTLLALNRVAEPRTRRRSEIIQQANNQAVRQAEYRAMGFALGWEELIEPGADAP